MVAMCPTLVRVSKSLVASRMGIGATSLISPTGSVSGLDQVLGSSAFDHALIACCESMRRN
jgi:hypothetical protein